MEDADERANGLSDGGGRPRRLARIRAYSVQPAKPNITAKMKIMRKMMPPFMMGVWCSGERGQRGRLCTCDGAWQRRPAGNGWVFAGSKAAAQLLLTKVFFSWIPKAVKLELGVSQVRARVLTDWGSLCCAEEQAGALGRPKGLVAR